jgi:hypothetical protein
MGRVRSATSTRTPEAVQHADRSRPEIDVVAGTVERLVVDEGAS